MNILFIINDGFEEIETITPYDILKRAGQNVTLSSNKVFVEGSHKLIVKADYLLSELKKENYDMLVLSGGRQYQENKNDSLYKEYVSYFAKNKAIASICATPAILGSLGLLNGKNYTLFTPMNEEFGGNFTNNRAETDGNIITSRSCGTAKDFAYEILKYIGGTSLVDKIKADTLD